MKKVKSLCVALALWMVVPAMASPSSGDVPGIIDMPEEANEKVQIQSLASCVQGLCQAKDYKKLDRLHSAYRAINFKLADGTTAVDTLYEVAAQQDNSFYMAWNKQNKDSAAPFLVGAARRIDQAWEARGSGWGDTVSEANARKFVDYLLKAHENLRSAQGRDGSNAILYKYWLTVSMGIGEKDEVRRMLLGRAKKGDPLSFEAYSAYLMGRLPRWGGSVKDLEATIKQNSLLWDAHLGHHGFYAAMRIRLSFVSDPFKEWPLDEDRFYTGVANLCAAYPRSISWPTGAVLIAAETKNEKQLRALVQRYRARLDPDQIDLKRLPR